MGIPRLHSRFRDANLIGRPQDIGRTGGAHHSQAIIDAPSLAHYIFDSVEAEASFANGSLDPESTYAQLGNRAIGQLEELESVGFRIEAIFFDGALPAGKAATRIGRLKDYTKRLSEYKSAHVNQLEKSRDNPWDTYSLRVAKRKAPPATLLVPAILEALLGSKYANRTFVVPDEADKYCVAAARSACAEDSELDVAIFTDDSDLLVYDSGAKTKIVGFRELDRHVDRESKRVLRSSLAWPSQMAKHLKCSDLTEIAFYMNKQQHSSVGELLKFVMPGRPPTHFPDWELFVKTYSLGGHQETLNSLRSDESLRKLCAALDPRVSELIRHATSPWKETPSIFPPDCVRPMVIFPPYLLEDPALSTPWLIGQNLRHLAYFELLDATGRAGETVYEFRGHGTRVFQSTPSTAQAIQNEYMTWFRLLLQPLDRFVGLSDTERWQFVMMQVVLAYFLQQRTMLPAPEDIVHIITGQTCATWELIDLKAHYVATYYSSRIMFQIFNWIFHAPSRDDIAGAQQNMYKLWMRLKGLPTIADFFDRAEGGELKTLHDKWIPIVESHLQWLEQRWKPQRQPSPRKPKWRTARKSGKDEVKTKAMSAISERTEEESDSGKNRFAALETE